MLLHNSLMCQEASIFFDWEDKNNNVDQNNKHKPEYSPTNSKVVFDWQNLMGQVGIAGSHYKF